MRAHGNRHAPRREVRRIDELTGPRGGTIYIIALECGHYLWQRKRPFMFHELACMGCWIDDQLQKKDATRSPARQLDDARERLNNNSIAHALGELVRAAYLDEAPTDEQRERWKEAAHAASLQRDTLIAALTDARAGRTKGTK